MVACGSESCSATHPRKAAFISLEGISIQSDVHEQSRASFFMSKSSNVVRENLFFFIRFYSPIYNIDLTGFRENLLIIF